MVATVHFARVTALPDPATPNTIYFVKADQSDTLTLYVTGDDATPVPLDLVQGLDADGSLATFAALAADDGASQIGTPDGSLQTVLSGLPKSLALINPTGSALSGFDLEHFAGQGGTSPVAGALHDYTDGPKTFQLDKVGGDQASQNYILGLRRAGNFVRRLDKAGNYVSDAGFIQATYDTWTDTATFTGVIAGNVLTVSGFSGSALAAGQRVVGAGILEGTAIDTFGTGTGGNGTYTLTVRGANVAQTIASEAMAASTKGSVQAWLVNKTGGHTWPVLPAVFSTSKPDGDTVYAYQAIAAAETQNLWSLSGYKTSTASVQVALTIQTDVNSTRVVIGTTSAKTAGFRLTTLAGPIALAPLAAAGSTLNPVSVTNGLTLSTSFTVAQLASYNATTYAGSLVRVSNGDAGAECLAFASGGVWKRISLGAAVSAT